MKNPRIHKALLSILALTLHLEVQAESNAGVLVKSGDPAPTGSRILYYSRQNNGHHSPSSFLASVRRDFGERGIQMTTSISASDLNFDKFNEYDGVFFFGNHGVFSTAQTAAIESYVQGGGGMVGMHVIAYVARGNATLSRLLGASFRGHHAISSFRSPLIQSAESYPDNLASHPDFPFPEGESYLYDPDHPILKGLSPYTSADEPYLHQTLNPDIILLGYREDHDNWDEPYTWVRHEGAGRVFYHANGHDSRTWSEPNFRELMIRGTSWVARTRDQNHLTFSAPYLSNQGTLQYMSQIETSNGPLLTVHTNGQESAMHGAQLPGNDESLQYFLTDSTRHTMFGNEKIILSTQAQAADQQLGALLAGHARYPQLIALATGPAGNLEAGFLFSADQNFPFVTDGQDTLIFSATIEDTAGGNQKQVIAISQNDLLSPLLIEGDSLHDDPSTVIAGFPEQSLYCSPSGELAIIAQIETAPSPATTHILTGTPDSLTSRVATGVTTPGLPIDSSFEEFLKPFAIQEDTLYFTARLGGGTTLPSNDEVITSTNSLGECTIIIREGDLIQDQVFAFPDAPILPTLRKNDILCGGLLNGVKCLVSIPPGSDPSILLSEGHSLMVENELQTITHLDLSSLMASATQAILPATLTAPDGVTELSCLLQVGSGTIRPLLLEGQTLKTKAEDFLISEIRCRPIGPHGDGLQDNQIRVLATSTLGDTAIVGIENIDDLDEDGMSDTIEMAFGGSIENSDAAVPPGYPKILSTPEGTMTLTYWQQTGPNTGLNYTIETSADLQNWTPATLETSLANDQSGVADHYERMIATVTLTENHRFFRFTF